MDDFTIQIATIWMMNCDNNWRVKSKMIEWTHCNDTVRPYFVGGTMNILICDDEKDFLDT